MTPEMSWPNSPAAIFTENKYNEYYFIQYICRMAHTMQKQSYDTIGISLASPDGKIEISK